MQACVLPIEQPFCLSQGVCLLQFREPAMTELQMQMHGSSLSMSSCDLPGSFCMPRETRGQLPTLFVPGAFCNVSCSVAISKPHGESGAEGGRHHGILS